MHNVQQLSRHQEVRTTGNVNSVGTIGLGSPCCNNIHKVYLRKTGNFEKIQRHQEGGETGLIDIFNLQMQFARRRAGHIDIQYDVYQVQSTRQERHRPHPHCIDSPCTRFQEAACPPPAPQGALWRCFGCDVTFG